MAVTASVKSLGIDRLNVDERLSLVEEIWASICAESGNFALTSAQRAMTLRVVYRKAAQAELDEAILYYERQRTGVGEELLSEK